MSLPLRAGTSRPACVGLEFRVRLRAGTSRPACVGLEFRVRVRVRAAVGVRAGEGRGLGAVQRVSDDGEREDHEREAEQRPDLRGE
eukprot:scaffold60306_cov57-Phaeocystis_antarctica.AAC.1